MISIRAFLDAARTFLDHLSQVQAGALGLSLGFWFANLVLRTRGWVTILRAAYPTGRVRFGQVLGAYLSGVGVNAIAPARSGDVVRVAATRQKIPGSSATTIAASLVAETTFDIVVAGAMLAWAYHRGLVPGLHSIPHKPAFEWAFFARHEAAVEVVAAVALFSLLIGLRWVAAHLRAFWRRVRRGVAILDQPARYLTGVVTYQALGWCCRVAAAYWSLRAFGVPATFSNALVVLVITSVSTLLPITPGGAGAQQALLVIALAGQASGTTLLAFSVGAQVATTTASIVVGAVGLLVTFKTLRPGRWRAHAAAKSATEP